MHASGEFVVNLVDEGIAETMNLTATDFPPGGGEPLALGHSDAAFDHHALPPRPPPSNVAAR
jgi:flavin reductase (DIM6/NTAB) family NADH-FMN oxidoreductase RutF